MNKLCARTGLAFLAQIGLLSAAPSEPIIWTNTVGASQGGSDGSTLTMTAPTSAWSAGATSSKSLAADGVVEFGADEVNTSRAVGLNYRDIGEPPVWTNLVNVRAVSGLVKTGSTGWDGGASSVQTIASGDGFVEFSAKPGTHRLCGLSRRDDDPVYFEIAYAFLMADGGTLSIYEGGAIRGVFGVYAEGDRLRVSVAAGLVQYWQNGTLLYSSAVPASYPLSADVWLHEGGSTITDVTISTQGTLSPVVWTNQQKVAIPSKLQKTGVTNWSAGASSRQGIFGDGFFEFSAKPGSHRAAGLSSLDSSASYDEIAFAFVLADGGTLLVYERGILRGTVGTYAAGDRLRVAVEGGVVKYRRNNAVVYTSAAAVTYPLVADTAFYETNATLEDLVIHGTRTLWDLDFGIHLRADGTAAAYESGRVVATLGTYASHDRFGISIEAGRVRYLRNGVVVATGGLARSPLSVEATLETTGATITNAAYGGASLWNVRWKDLVGTTGEGNHLYATATPLDWDAGAVSTRSLSGDGYVEFTATDATTWRMVGLGRGNANTLHTDIEFAVYLRGDGLCGIYEGGVNRGEFGSYRAGDRFRVEVHGNTVTYKRNGAAFYTSALTAQFPLLVDTSFATPRSAVSNVVLFGQNAPPIAVAGVAPEGDIAEPVGFDARASTGDIVQYDWDFGDTTSGSGAQTTHAYDQPGVYEVTLRVTDDGGATGVATATVKIGSPKMPTFMPPAGPFALTERVTLITTTADAIIRYTTNGSDPTEASSLYIEPIAITTLTTIKAKAFKSGRMPSATASATYTPAAATTEPVTQWRNKVNVAFASANTFYMSGGAYGTAGASSIKAIAGGAGYVEFTAPEPIEYDEYGNPKFAGVTVGLSNGDSNQNAGDIDFAICLTYGMVVALRDPGGWLAQIPEGTLWYSPGDRFRVEVILISGQPRVRYYQNGWLLGESARPPSYPLVVDTGIERVGGYVHDVVMSGVLTSSSPRPVAAPGGPYQGVAESSLTFDGSASSAAQGTLVSYLWAFGDGATGTGRTTSHTYARAGTYPVSLTVVDSQGLTASASTTATIAEPPIEIFNVRTTEVGTHSAVIAWEANRPMTGEVQLGTTTNYDQAVGVAAGSTSYTTEVENLDGETHYNYRVVALRGGNVAAASENQSFTTSSPGVSLADGGTPIAIAPGTPAGSYALSGLDVVNFFNGSLHFELPILTMGGRGEAETTISLPIERRWILASEQEPPDSGQWRHFSTFKSSVFHSFAFQNGIVHLGTVMAKQSIARGDGSDCGSETAVPTLTRITFTRPNGTETEFLDATTNGAALDHCSTRVRGRLWLARDGSGAKFISDVSISDALHTNGAFEFPVAGLIFLRDGTRLRADNGIVTRITDTNGNFIRYERQNRRIIDSMGRVATFLPASEAFPNGPCGTLQFTGVGGRGREVVIGCTSLGNALVQPSPLLSQPPFVPSPGVPWNPEVVSSVTIPDGRSYTFRYNQYGELARVTLPSGGIIEYDHAAGVATAGADGDGVIIHNANQIYAKAFVYRRVVERRLYASDGELEQVQRISRPETNHFGQSVGFVEVAVSKGGGGVLARERHYFHGTAIESFNLFSPGDHEKWNMGKEHKTEFFDSDSRGAHLLRTLEQVWEQCEPTDDTALCTPRDVPPNWNPHIKEQRTILDDGAVQRQLFHYDAAGNVLRTFDHDFSGNLLRRRETQYSKAHGLLHFPDNPADPNHTVHILDLPIEDSVFDGAGQLRSRLSYEYDSGAPLVDRGSVVGWQMPSSGKRGNLTAEKTWLDRETRTVTVARHDYDILGNRVKSANALSHATTFEYGPETAFGLPRSVTNALGHRTLMEHDLPTGKRLRQTDPNGVVTTYEYDDALDRLTRVVRADNWPEQTETRFSYDDDQRVITTVADLDENADLVSRSVYDGLGRTTQVETAAPDGDIRVVTAYDAFGRAREVSHPFRSGEPDRRTTTEYDGVGRVVSVTTPDGASVPTEYAGPATTVMDPAGKRRRSVTDAMGRVTRVTEDPDGLALHTDYEYDALGNLTLVRQGAQVRTFEYDSLSRLRRATNPESGDVTYHYDDNGNLRRRIDARGIETHQTYDKLDRIRDRSYTVPANVSAEVAPTQEVHYSYDRARAGIGRLSDIVTSDAATHTQTYDGLGRITSLRQAVGGRTYPFAYRYNAGGLVTRMEYPSGLVVTTDYDSAGRITAMHGGKPNGLPITFIQPGSVQYAAHGAITAMALGNGIQESTGFDSNRLQPTSLSVGSLLDLSWGYGGSNNNGNVLEQTIRVGGWSRGQDYDYDPLNRLRGATEQGSWSQSFGYDRFGNRWVEGQTLNPSPQAPTAPHHFNARNQITLPSFVYDSAGNERQSGPGTGLVYDAESRLAQFSGPAGATQYRYDGDGRRVVKVHGSAQRVYVYDAFGRLATEHATGGNQARPVKDYVFAGSRLLSAVEGSAIAGTAVLRTIGPKGSIDNCVLSTTNNFSWEPISGARDYLLKIDGVDYGTYPASLSCDATLCGVEPDAHEVVEPFAPGGHTWMVQARGTGWESEWSASTEYVVIGPQPPRPITPNTTLSTTNGEVLYKWTDSPGAIRYTVWLDDDNIGTALPNEVCVSGICTLPRPLPSGGNHKWRVTTSFPSCAREIPSLPLKFGADGTVGGVPIPISPKGTIYTRRPLFKWRAAQGATGYSVEVEGAAQQICLGCQPLSCVAGICQIRAQDFGLIINPEWCTSLNGPDCQWRVRATTDDAVGAWSPFLSFKVDPFILLFPMDGTTVSSAQALAFQWGRFNAAREYHLTVVGPTNQTQEWTMNSSLCNDAFCTWPAVANGFLAAAGEYSWHIEAVGEQEDAVSDTWRFYIPSCEAQCGTQAAACHMPSCGTRQDCHDDCDEAHATCVAACQAPPTPTPTPTPGPTPTPTPPPFTLLFPMDGTIVSSAQALSLQWRPFSAAREYRLTVAGPASQTQEWTMNTSPCDGTFCTWFAGANGFVPAPGHYRWHVQAIGEHGNAVTDTWRFHIPSCEARCGEQASECHDRCGGPNQSCHNDCIREHASCVLACQPPAEPTPTPRPTGSPSPTPTPSPTPLPTPTPAPTPTPTCEGSCGLQAVACHNTCGSGNPPCHTACDVTHQACWTGCQAPTPATPSPSPEPTPPPPTPTPPPAEPTPTPPPTPSPTPDPGCMAACGNQSGSCHQGCSSNQSCHNACEATYQNCLAGCQGGSAQLVCPPEMFGSASDMCRADGRMTLMSADWRSELLVHSSSAVVSRREERQHAGAEEDLSGRPDRPWTSTWFQVLAAGFTFGSASLWRRRRQWKTEPTVALRRGWL